VGFAPSADQGEITNVREVGHIFRELCWCIRRKVDANFAGICGRGGRRIWKGRPPGGKVMGSEYNPTEEVTAARWHEHSRSHRATTKRGVVVCEVTRDLVEEFLGEAGGP